MGQVPDHFFQQSAVLAYRHDRGNLEILLVTSRRKKRWVIPKGVREPDLDAVDDEAVHTSYDVWPESYRDRQWFEPQEAAAKVDEPDLKQIILRFAASAAKKRNQYKE